MTRIVIVAKKGGGLLQDTQASEVILNEPSVVQVGVNKEDVASIVREGNAVVITLVNGETIKLENFFDDGGSDNSLVFPDEENGFVLVNFDEAGVVIDYSGLESIDPLLYSDNDLLPWLIVPAGLGAIFWWADDGGKSRPVDKTPPEVAAILDKITEDTGVSDKDFITNDNTLIFGGKLDGKLAADEKVQISLDGGKSWVDAEVDRPSGTWKFDNTANPLADGNYDVWVRTIDANNNVGPITKQKLVIDTVAPEDNSLSDEKLLDDIGPLTGEIKDGTVTDDAQPEFTGKAKPDVDHVNIYDGDKLIGKADVKPDGTWSFTPDQPLAEGPHNFSAKPVDKAGNEGKATNPIKFTVDTTPIDTNPPADDSLIDVVLLDDVDPITGEIKDGTVTDDAQPELTGKATSDVDTVNVYDGDKLLGTAKVNPEDGTWSFTPEKPLTDGPHSFIAKPVDKAGNEGKGTDPIDFTVDTVPPADNSLSDVKLTDDVGPLTGEIKDGSVTDDAQPELTGKATPDVDHVNIYDGDKLLGKADVKPDGTWSFTPEKPLADGPHSFIAKPVDKAGNEGKGTDPIDFDVDTVPPVDGSILSIEVYDDVGPKTGLIQSGDTTDDTQPTIRGEATPDVDTVNIYDNGKLLGTAEVQADGTWSFTPSTPLTGNAHSITAKPVDKAGNEGKATTPIDFSLDAAAPAAPAITEVYDDVGTKVGALEKGQTTDDKTPTVSGTGTEGAIIHVYSNGTKVGETVVKDGKWSVTLDDLGADGEKKITAVAENAAGQRSPETGVYPIILDTLAPEKPSFTAEDDVGEQQGLINPDDTTDDRTPTFEGKGNPDDVIKLYDNDQLIGETTVKPDGTWSFTPSTPLADGPHSVTVTATDPAGNTSTASDPLKFTVDTTTASLTIDGVRDDQAPVEGIIAKGGITNDTTPTLFGQTQPNQTVVIKDENGQEIIKVQANGKGEWEAELPTQTDGAKRYTAETVLPNGTTAKAEIDFTIDSAAPNAPSIDAVTDDVGEIQGPLKSGDSTDDTTPTLSGKAEPGHDVNIYVDGKPVATVKADDKGDWNYTVPAPGLSEGPHQFEVTQTDAAGNESGKSAPFDVVVDVTAPTATAELTAITEDTGTAGDFLTKDNTLVFSGDVAGSLGAGEKVQVRVDGGEWKEATVSGSTWSYDHTGTPLTEGKHKVETRVVDAAGNPTLPLATDVTIDKTVSSPAEVDLKITSISPDNGVPNDGKTSLANQEELRVLGTVTGNLASDEVVEVRLGNGQWTEVTVQNGQWSFNAGNLKDGDYKVEARVIDKAGNIGDQDSFDITIDSQLTASIEISDYEDNGDSATDFYSNDDEFILKVRTEADATVVYQTLINNVWTPLGTNQANSAGESSYAVDWSNQQLNDVERKFRAIITDEAGNTQTVYLGGKDEASAQTYRVDNVADTAELDISKTVINADGKMDVFNPTFQINNSGERRINVYEADYRGEHNVNKEFLFTFSTDANGSADLSAQLKVLGNFKKYIFEGVDAAGNSVVYEELNRVYHFANDVYQADGYQSWYYEPHTNLTSYNPSAIFYSDGVNFYNDSKNLAGYANRYDGFLYAGETTVILKLPNNTTQTTVLNENGYWEFSYDATNPIANGEIASVTFVANAMRDQLQANPSIHRDDQTADFIISESNPIFFANTYYGTIGSYSHFNSPEVFIKGQAGSGDSGLSIVGQTYTSTRDNDAIYSNGIATKLVYEVLDTITASMNSNGKYLGETGTTIGQNGYGSQFSLDAFGNINMNGWIDRDGDDQIIIDERYGDFVDIDGDGIHDGASADADRVVTDIWNHFDIKQDTLDISAWIAEIESKSTTGLTIDETNIDDYLSIEHVLNAKTGATSTVLSIDRDGAGSVYESQEFLTLEARKHSLQDLLDNNNLIF